MRTAQVGLVQPASRDRDSSVTRRRLNLNWCPCAVVIKVIKGLREAEQQKCKMELATKNPDRRARTLPVRCPQGWSGTRRDGTRKRKRCGKLQRTDEGLVTHPSIPNGWMEVKGTGRRPGLQPIG